MGEVRTQPIVRLLVLSSLYPNSVQPRHGIFVEERLRSLVGGGAVTARVVAPVPWFPFGHPLFGRYAQFACVPRREVRHGIEVLHPRYPVVPRVGMLLGPPGMAAAVMRVVRHLLLAGDDFDLIDAHYFYPDGVAAASVARKLDKPVVITARGSDINTIAQMPRPGRQIVRAAQQAVAVSTVSRALKQSLIELGVPEGKLITLRNGVDLNRFAPTADRQAMRAELGIHGSVWIAVGHLIELKGVHIAIEALTRVSDVTLLIVGQGPDKDKLRYLANRCGVADRTLFVGSVAHDELPRYYNAADALVLAARSEGMPNVVLEAMACGTAVIATNVGGIPELLENPVTGALMRDRTPEAVAGAWQRVCEYGVSSGQRQARRDYAQRFGWTETTQGQLNLFRRVLGRGEPGDCGMSVPARAPSKPAVRTEDSDADFARPRSFRSAA